MRKLTCILLSIILFIHSSNGQFHALLCGKIENCKKDSIKITLEINSIVRDYKTFLIPVINGRFKNELPISKPTFIFLSDGVNYVDGLIEPGDSIVINYDANNKSSSLNFTGKGSDKFLFSKDFYKFEWYKKIKERIPVAKEKKYPFDYFFEFIDSAGDLFLNQLNSIKNSMSAESFSLLYAAVEGNIISDKFISISMIHHENLDETLEKRQDELTSKSTNTIQNILKFENNFYNSTEYVNDVFNMLFVYYEAQIFSKKMSADIIRKYNYLDSLLPPNLKAPVLAIFLESDIDKLNDNDDIETVIKHVYLFDKDSVYKNYITNRYDDARSLRKGMNAPEFVLENEKGEKVTLSTFKGKVVYIDFWFDACGPCKALFKLLEPVKKYYARNDKVVFLYVSVDSKDVWKTSLKNHSLEGYQVFTENKENNHPIIKAYHVNGYPTPRLIDENGKFFIVNPSNNPDELQKEIQDALMSSNN